ncbi:MAG: AI-2E family transporter [Treponema sp.]|jgi:predicted PurR-regulated permease PerM|nr:AI-2E family transporter [Treponema sp.]
MRDRFKSFNTGRAVFLLVALIAFFLTAVALRTTASVILPFTIALLFALVIGPLVSLMAKIHIPRVIAILLVVITVVAALVFIGVLLFGSGRAILRVYPRYETRLTEIYLWVGQFFDISYNDELSFIQNLWYQLGSQIRLFTFQFSNSFFNFIKDSVIVGILMVFLLVESVFFKEKLSVAFEGKWAGQIGKISTDIVTQVSRYLSIKFIISVANGIIIGVLLHLVGVEFAEVWGLIQFILNFIPSLGSIAVGVLVSLFSLAQFWPEPVPIILTMVIMIGINMIIGYVLEPKIMGDRLGLSPVVILVSLLIWGWIWGFAGMILAVPMMVIIKIVCENFPVLEPISILLGSRRSVLAKKAEYEEAAGKETEERSKEQ